MKKNKFIITITVVVLVNAAALGAWFYLFSALGQEDSNIFEIQGKALVNDENSKRYKELDIFMDKTADERKILDSVFLDKESIIKIIEELEANAEKTGVAIKLGNINIGENKTQKPSLNFSLNGDFNQIFHYLLLLENMPYSVEVKKTQLQKEGKVGAQSKWNAEFEILLNNFITI